MGSLRPELTVGWPAFFAWALSGGLLSISIVIVISPGAGRLGLYVVPVVALGLADGSVRPRST